MTEVSSTLAPEFSSVLPVFSVLTPEVWWIIVLFPVYSNQHNVRTWLMYNVYAYLVIGSGIGFSCLKLFLFRLISVVDLHQHDADPDPDLD